MKTQKVCSFQFMNSLAVSHVDEARETDETGGIVANCNAISDENECGRLFFFAKGQQRLKN
jgi:hypothetical protein